MVCRNLGTEREKKQGLKTLDFMTYGTRMLLI